MFYGSRNLHWQMGLRGTTELKEWADPTNRGNGLAKFGFKKYGKTELFKKMTLH
jgi:hypothetical protein